MDTMAVEESLNNRAWPFLQDAPPQPQQMVCEHASAAQHEAVNNNSGVPGNNAAVDSGHGDLDNGWLLGLRSFLPMAPYGGAVAPPADGIPLHGYTGANGNAAAHQTAQGAAIQWLPGSDLPMQSPSEGTGWSHGDSAPMVTDSPPHPAQQSLNWGPQLGAAFGAGAVSAQSRSPTGRGPNHARPRGHAGAVDAAMPQPEADAEARGGSGGDGSLVSSATAMQDIRSSSVLRALDGWGGATGRDHPVQPATQGACLIGSGVTSQADPVRRS